MRLHDFIRLQLEEIDRHKWIESQKAGRDLGEEAVFDWVRKYANDFRRYVVEDLDETVIFPNGICAPPMNLTGSSYKFEDHNVKHRAIQSDKSRT
jgi:hypothetical protein